MGVVLAALAILSIPEAIIAHVLLTHWNPKAAWVITALGLYGTLFLMAASRSFRLRPSYLYSGELVLRNGLIWTLRVPVSRIASISTGSSDGNVRLEFTSPVVLRKLYGFERRVETAALAIDNPRELVAALDLPR